MWEKEEGKTINSTLIQELLFSDSFVLMVSSMVIHCGLCHTASPLRTCSRARPKYRWLRRLRETNTHTTEQYNQQMLYTDTAITFRVPIGYESRLLFYFFSFFFFRLPRLVSIPSYLYWRGWCTYEYRYLVSSYTSSIHGIHSDCWSKALAKLGADPAHLDLRLVGIYSSGRLHSSTTF